MEVQPGTVIDDKFRIENVLGEGAVGVVVGATHLKLGTQVAIKFLQTRLLRDSVVVERFAREARASALLQSEHVARVLDVGNFADGAPYMVMEWLHGETVAASLKRRRVLPIGEACRYMMQVCTALTEAHSRGIVHRDLKPANLFLANRPNGRIIVKVLDFGISKMYSPMSSVDAELTMASTILGTPLYMAPEQIASSRTVDGRADVWSCGVCLHRMLSGHVPFDADSLPALGAKVLRERPPNLHAIRPEIPQQLADVVLRCLERDVERRWQSAQELHDALERFAMPMSASGSTPAAIDDETEAYEAPTAFIKAAVRPDAKSRKTPPPPPPVVAMTMTTSALEDDETEAVTSDQLATNADLSRLAGHAHARMQSDAPIVDVTLAEAAPPVPLGIVRPSRRTTAEQHGAEFTEEEAQTRVARRATRPTGPVMPPHHTPLPQQPPSYPQMYGGQQQHHPSQQHQQQHSPSHYPSGSGPYPMVNSRNAPTVHNRPQNNPFAFLNGIEHHPYFGVGVVVMAALLIVAIVLSLRGC